MPGKEARFIVACHAGCYVRASYVIGLTCFDGCLMQGSDLDGHFTSVREINFRRDHVARLTESYNRMLLVSGEEEIKKMADHGDLEDGMKWIQI